MLLVLCVVSCHNPFQASNTEQQTSISSCSSAFTGCQPLSLCVCVSLCVYVCACVSNDFAAISTVTPDGQHEDPYPPRSPALIQNRCPHRNGLRNGSVLRSGPDLGLIHPAVIYIRAGGCFFSSSAQRLEAIPSFMFCICL